MTVSILVITHENIGNALLSAAASTLGGELPLPTTIVTVNYETDPSALLPRLKKLIQAIEAGQGVLILTDLYGSTPSNIARNLQVNEKIRVITGLNLPMLIRTMNYPHLCLTELAEKAISGGKAGVINCSELGDQNA